MKLRNLIEISFVIIEDRCSVRAKSDEQQPIAELAAILVTDFEVREPFRLESRGG